MVCGLPDTQFMTVHRGNAWRTVSGNTVALDLMVLLAWGFACTMAPVLTTMWKKLVPWTLSYGSSSLAWE